MTASKSCSNFFVPLRESIENINKQFIYASWCGYLPIVKLLIKKGADIHIKNDTAIIHAAYHGYSSIVKLLIDLGANIRVPARR